MCSKPRWLQPKKELHFTKDTNADASSAAAAQLSKITFDLEYIFWNCIGQIVETKSCNSNPNNHISISTLILSHRWTFQPISELSNHKVITLFHISIKSMATFGNVSSALFIKKIIVLPGKKRSTALRIWFQNLINKL